MQHEQQKEQNKEVRELGQYFKKGVVTNIGVFL